VKKSERLNDMLMYLNDKKYFHLKNIMDQYSISKSTALRDIQSLEEIGLPIYSKPGRNGFYGILSSRLLSPIVFTIDEVQALYFSMQTLKAYQSTPFHLSIEKLKEKFEACVSEERIKVLRKMEEVFTLGSYRNKNECCFLKDILRMAIDEHVCKIEYKKESKEKVYHVQFFDITSAYGQWYATGYNFEMDRPQVFRCDKIQSVCNSENYSPKQLSEFSADSRKIFRGSNAIDFQVGISLKGVDLFHKEHYPSMKLHYEGEKYYINGFFNKGEEKFIADYFLMYGDMITSIQPSSLKNIILKRLNTIQNYISSQL
jgi:predicted DNA-binding transcriptional regulator YafY